MSHHKAKSPHAPRRKQATSPITRAEEFARVLDLRRTGMTLRAMATEMGYADHAGVLKLLRAAISDIPKEARDELIAIESERLELLQNATWEHALTGDPQSVAVALRVMERRASLLGLDAKRSVDVNLTESPEWADIRERIALALAKHPAARAEVKKALEAKAGT